MQALHLFVRTRIFSLRGFLCHKTNKHALVEETFKLEQALLPLSMLAPRQKNKSSFKPRSSYGTQESRKEKNNPIECEAENWGCPNYKGLGVLRNEKQETLGKEIIFWFSLLSCLQPFHFSLKLKHEDL